MPLFFISLIFFSAPAMHGSWEVADAIDSCSGSAQSCNMHAWLAFTGGTWFSQCKSMGSEEIEGRKTLFFLNWLALL